MGKQPQEDAKAFAEWFAYIVGMAKGAREELVITLRVRGNDVRFLSCVTLAAYLGRGLEIETEDSPATMPKKPDAKVHQSFDKPEYLG